MPFSKQALRPQIETGSNIVGRTNEQYFFSEHVLRPVEPAYNLISVWGEAGVGKSTLLTRFRDTACSTEFKDVCLTALVDEWPMTPVHLMERVAAQLRRAGAPLVAFERILARYKEAMRSQPEEQEAARAAFLRQVSHLPGGGVRGEPVIGSLYAAVAEEASASFWDERRSLRSGGIDALEELTRAFVEDLNWLTATQVLYPSYRSRRGLRVILFFDGMEPSAGEAVNWLLNHLLAASISQNVVLVVAGRDPIAPALPDEQAIYSMPLARFTEDETRLYLAARGIIAADRCNTIWQVSGGLPLTLSLLTLDHGAVIDLQEDTPTNVLRWLARQGQSKQRLVLHAALFSGPFHQDELTAFRFLPESEQERTRLYRWLIALPFVQHRALDGRHRYHRLAREWFSHALLQRSAQEYQVSRRALVNYYRRQLARLEQDVGQQLSTSTVWLELAQALVYQLLCSPGDASHTSAVEQSLVIVHMAKHKADIISLLRACLQEPPQSKIDVNARAPARELLRYLEADLAGQEFLAAASALVERVSRAPAFPASLLARIYGKRGTAYSLRGELKLALADFDQALALDPTYGGVSLLRGIASSASSEYRQAIEDFTRALALDPNNTFAYAHRGMASRKLKDYEQAMADFDRVLALDPHFEEASLLRSLTYEKFNEERGGLGSFDQVIERNPSDAQAHIQRGMALCSLGEYDRAIENLTQALALDPGAAQVYAGRGHVYLEMGDLERATTDFRRSLEYNPLDVHVGLLCEWAGMRQGALDPETPARLEAIAAMNPQQYSAYVCRGMALLLRERLEEALVQLEQGLLLDTRKGHAYFWKSLACALLGRDEDAVANLVRAKTAELPLPEALFAPLSWLEQKRPDFYRAYAVPLVANP
jgi:tetratricopeptide (TPR) repeat protein